ncbi:MAG: ribosome assembly cofactor RimP [Bacteroidales bacterium]|nr:ribosome assembly cofactor RimP [Bacteroidales bacterium]NPV37353.1 ribosome assembly cofactor RimP [Bacteroidales bacterium]
MIDNFKLLEIIDTYLEGTPFFLVELKVKTGNRIMVFIDGDQGVSIDDCVNLSRHIESKLDRNIEDYSLEVSSAGADSPLKFKRQYPKHIGRTLHVKHKDNNEFRGELVAVNDKEIVLKILEKQKTPQGKPKRVLVEKAIPYEEILEARIELSFK